MINTTSHFIIQDCLFESPVFDYPIRPITLTNVSNGMVLGNQIVNSQSAIGGYHLSNCTISDNALKVTTEGISLSYSNSTVISNNTQGYEPCDVGLFIHHCRNCTISLNEFKNIKYSGMMSWGLYDVSIFDNSFSASIVDPYLSWDGIMVGGGQYCSIRGNVLENFGFAGLDIMGTDSVVENNNVTSCSKGLLISTQESTITSNILINNSVGIEMVQANDTEVYENTVQGRRGSHETGITMSGGHDCEVYLNNITRVGAGFYLQGATGFNISDNSVTNGRYGFAFGWTSSWWNVPNGPFFDCNITNNSFDSGGLYPEIENYEDWDFNTIRFEENRVSNRPIGFFAYLDDIELDGSEYGQLFCVSCTNVRVSEGDFSGIKSDRVVYDDYYDTGVASAITLLNCTGFDLSGTRFQNNTIGVYIKYSSDCFLDEISGDENSLAAISVVSSGNIRISDGYFVNNSKAIEFRSSWSSRIFNCLIWDNEEAITLSICPNFTITHNVIFRNIDAIYLGDSDRCNIAENDIYSNSRGLLLNSSSYCLITRNNVSDNAGVGICLDFTAHLNNIYENTFANNSPNAICEGSSNNWDNQIDTGNRWSDYSGEGPYIIDEDDQDNYPIVYLPPTTPTEPWELDPLILLVGGGTVGLVALVIIIREKRRVIIVD